MCFSGDQVTYLRKHTGNVFDDLEVMLMRIMKGADNEFIRMSDSASKMGETHMNDIEAWRMMGLLFGKGILSPRQLPVVKKEWKKPRHMEFREKNVWSFYNACTEALKSTPPRDILTRHAKLHKELAQA